MNSNRQQSRLAWTFVLVGLALSASGLGYMWYAGRPRRLDPAPTLHPGSHSPELAVGANQLQALTNMLLITFLLFIAFVGGSYLMIRFGRLFLSRARLGGRTQYVDAWGAYRLSDAQIAEATFEADEPPPSPGAPPDGPRET